MIWKIALCDLTAISTDMNTNSDQNKMVRTASGRVLIEPNSDKAKIIEAEIKKHPTALFFRAKAIKANEANSNGDYFSEEELIKSYKTFEGVPFFTNHDNQHIENARGKIVFAEWVPEEKAVYTIAFVDREAFPHICRSIEEEYVNGVSMGALSPGAKISTPNFIEVNIEDVKIGDMVMSHKNIPRKVVNIHSEYLGKDMYTFDLMTYHKSPYFTNDHPIFCINREEILHSKKESIRLAHSNMYERRKGYTEEFVGQDGWRNSTYNADFKEASHIEIGDHFLIPSKFKLKEGSSKDSDLFYLMGTFLGDGYLTKDKEGNINGIGFVLNLNEVELAEKIVKLFGKYSDYRCVCKPITERNGLSILIYDRKLANKFNDYCNTGFANKRIKYNVEYIEDAKQLLSGYLDTDGCVVDKTNQKTQIRGNKFGGLQFSSANIKLLEDFQSLLIALGRVSRISTMFRTPSENSLVRIDTIEHTLSTGSNGRHLFEYSVKMALKNPPEAEILAGSSFITEIDNVKYMACPVTDIITKSWNEPVYDLTVEEDESYIADGVAVHNCSVDKSICNICGNSAEKTEDYCSHIKDRKGRKFSGTAKNVNTGEIKKFKDELVFEYNHGIKFIELSAVVDPACKSCLIQGIIPNDEYIKKVANVQNSLYMIKTAAIEKEASKEEIDQLNTVLETLEQIAVSLIQNRQNVEVEFASDLVAILSELQTFVDELVGAGYGNVQGAIPGVANNQPGLPQPNQAPMPDMQANPSAQATPVSEEQNVGQISGNPTKPLVSMPNLPVTPPKKPMASQEDRILRISSLLSTIKEITNKNSIIHEDGDIDMGKRRTISEKIEQKKVATEVLSNSWQEKQDFFKYISNMPSIQDNMGKLSVKMKDDSFIIVAENKNDESGEFTKTWTYENLTDEQRRIIKESPRKAAQNLLDTFNKNLTYQKEGVTIMTDNTKQAGASSVNEKPTEITEAQLAKTRDLYHGRTKEEQDSITEKQLDENTKAAYSRKGEETVLTEKQLAEKSNRLHPRTEEEIDELPESQLDNSNASPRKNDTPNEITDAQLESSRSGDQTVLTEKQLNNIAAPWARSAKRNASLFVSASEHMSKVVDTIADTVIATGCTPKEACVVAGNLVATTKDRFNFTNEILNHSGKQAEVIDYSTRLAYWSNKNIRVASVGTKEIASSIISGLGVVASDERINPDVVVDAMDVLAEDLVGVDAISKSVEEKLAKKASKAENVKSVKSELRSFLKAETKEAREEERKEILASVETSAKMTREAERATWGKKVAGKIPDTKIIASFEEVGVKKDDPTFRSAIKSFARGALASQNIRLAAITNVTIDGDTISIAVQTGEGDQSVEIPINGGNNSINDDTMPEGDLGGEGLGNSLPSSTAKSKDSIKKEAQVPAGGGVPNTPSNAGGGTQAPNLADGGVPAGDPVGALMGDGEGDMEGEVSDEIPTAGQQQPLGTICPECGTSDVDVSEEGGTIHGKCKNSDCGAEYEALVKKEVEYKLIKPSKKTSGEGNVETPEVPEVPALPVAAQTRLNKGSLTRIASNKEKFGNVCPACGMNSCKASTFDKGVEEYHCPACGTDVQKEIIVNASNPSESYLRVKWDLIPDVENCGECAKAAKKLAANVRVQRMMKAASDQYGTTPFPMANCKELVAKKYGGQSLASFGPCKGKLLADCVCGQLEKLAMTKVRHMEKLASVYTQKDPMDECVQSQKEKHGYDIKQATTICKCLKKKYASKADDNVFMQAFADDIASGKEKMLKEDDLEAMNDIFTNHEEDMDHDEGDVDVDMSEVTAPSETSEPVTIEVSKETAQELASAAQGALETIEIDVEEVAPETEEVAKVEEVAPVPVEDINPQGEENMALAMQSHKLRRVGDEVVKIASTPTKVEEVGSEVKGLPRSKATIGNEGPDNIDVKLNKPSVPRSKAEMGNEGADNINPKADLPDVPVDSSYMGGEKDAQKGMPSEINNKIKGTVIAKKMTEVETVEKNVKDVPRSKATIGNEGPDNIDVKTDKPDVPRSNAEMGNEGADNINPKVDGPDVPIDNSYMGDEKEVQKGMPGINSEILKNVQQSRSVQLERVANARKIKAIEVAAKLMANKRISEAAYEDVIEALSHFEIDKIAVKADTMYPKKVVTASVATDDSDVRIATAIVMESKEMDKLASSQGSDLQSKLASHFTIGSRSFDSGLKQIGEK